MTTETEIFSSIKEAQDAKLRSKPRHTNGFYAKHTDVLNDGTIQVIWTNDLTPPPPPPRPLTQRQFIEELALPRNVRIT